MHWLRELLSRIASFSARSRHEFDLDEDVEAHIALAAAEHMRRGMSASEARTAALREFGGVTQVKEAYRTQHTFVFFDVLSRDLRFALRRLRRSPGFAIVVVLTLALGIGANTAIFTLVQGILLRSLPVSDASRLYRIGDKTDCCYFDSFENDNGDFDLFSYDLYRRFRDSAPEFEQLAAVQAGGTRFTVRWGATPARSLRAEYVSGNYFTTLGVNTFAGRPLSPSDDTPGAVSALVLSYEAWQSNFGGDASIVGSTVYLDRQAFTVAGIAPPGFYGDRISPFPPEIWVPLNTEPLFEGDNSALRTSNSAWLYAIGRMRPGVNLSALQSRLSATLRQWLTTQPSFTNSGGATLIPRQHVVLSQAGGGIQKMQQQTGTGLRVLMILSSIVLLLACANIANLLLARGRSQRAEIAVRIGLGATRGRIVRQILTESLILSTIGGFVGLIVAFFGARALLALAFPLSKGMPITADPSWKILLFAFAVSLLTGLLFAAAPAWTSSRAQPIEASRAVNSTSRDHASTPQRILLIVQLALSVVLIASAFLATRSLYNLEHQPIGLETQNRYSVMADLKGAGYTPDRLPALYRAMEDRLRALPGMQRISFARYLPLEGNEWGSCVQVQGHPAPGPQDPCFADWDRVSAQFLSSVGVPILRGRGFTSDDRAGTQSVALVNQAFVRRFFPNSDPLGKHFGLNGPPYAGAFEIVGVFSDFKLSDARGEARPLFLVPSGQPYTGYKSPELAAAEISSLYLNSIVLQFDRSQADAEKLVRSAIAEVNPAIPVIRVRAYPQVVADNFTQDRLLARLTEAFGLLALVLASIGLYGVMSYIAAGRTAEIGIRMALGASRSGIVVLMLRGAVVQLVVGFTIGILASLFAGHLMQKLLYQIKGNDAASLLGAVAALGLCATVASLVPALRAAAMDPMRALRTD